MTRRPATPGRRYSKGAKAKTLVEGVDFKYVNGKRVRIYHTKKGRGSTKGRASKK